MLKQNALVFFPILCVSNNFYSLEISSIFRKILWPQNKEEMKNEDSNNTQNIKHPESPVFKHLRILGGLVF